MTVNVGLEVIQTGAWPGGGRSQKNPTGNSESTYWN